MPHLGSFLFEGNLLAEKLPKRPSRCGFVAIFALLDGDKDPGHGASQAASQSHMAATNHRHDLTGDAQMGMPRENCPAGMPIPAMLSDNQCGVLFKEDDWCGQIARAILTVQ